MGRAVFLAFAFKTSRFLTLVVALQIMVVLVRNFQYTIRSVPGRQLLADLQTPPEISNTQPGVLNSHSVILNISASFEEQLNNLTKENATLEGIERFLETYETYCQRLLANRSREGPLPWCDCVPKHLVGRQNLTQSLPKKPSLKEIEEAHPEMANGHWKPSHCTPRQNIAIIIPYRARELHLLLFLHHMIPFLQRQLVEFTIFVAEQRLPEVFNKASLMNAGFMATSKNDSFDCYFFHDIDTMPEDDRNIYTCTDNPRHLGYYVSRYKYVGKYPIFVGGGVAFTAKQFHRCNGVSNKFYGWGGEDDDMYFRIVHAGMHVTRFPVSVARYTILSHVRDSGNPNNELKTQFVKATKKDTKRSYLKEGLNTLKYTVKRVERQRLFTRILIDLPPPPKNYKFNKNGHRE